jgi:hypothetical protein
VSGRGFFSKGERDEIEEKDEGRQSCVRVVLLYRGVVRPGINDSRLVLGLLFPRYK